MEINYKREENGKSMVSIRRNTHLYFNDGGSKFVCDKENMFITELKLNHSDNQSRKFAISIRLDGHKDNNRYHKISQMSFSEDELRSVRDQIDRLLQDSRKESR